MIYNVISFQIYSIITKICIHYTAFLLIIKYWLYSLCSTIYPCSLFTVYISLIFVKYQIAKFKREKRVLTADKIVNKQNKTNELIKCLR